jgi:FkbM family methyltransferase
MTICKNFNSHDTCGDGICTSPEFAESCPSDCGEVLLNPRFLRSDDPKAFGWIVQPEGIPIDTDTRNAFSIFPGIILVQSRLRLFPSTSYPVAIDANDVSCIEAFIHSSRDIFVATSGAANTSWTVPKSWDGDVNLTIRSVCRSEIRTISIKPVPLALNVGWRYYDIVDSILYQPERIAHEACRQKCLDDPQCCAWQTCPGTDAEGCGGCYILGRRPDEISAEMKDGWFASIERSLPLTGGLSAESCRRWLLAQSAHEKDFYDMSSGKLQKYVDCASLIRRDKTVPKQLFIGGIHWPTILVANHRNPDPRVSAGGVPVLPHFYTVPFYDTNIGDIMKQTSSMNIVQSYELQSILNPGEVFVDIGANLGSYTIPLGEWLGPFGIVIAMEPFRWLFQILNSNIALNGLMNCWTYQVALSEESGEEFLLQPNLRHFSSPGGVKVDHQTTSVSDDTRRQLYDHEWGSEIVQIKRLDDIIFSGSVFKGRNRTLQVDLIKIDVEGMESKVIKGSEKVLKELQPIVWVENVDYFQHNDTSFLVLMDTVMGYKCYKSLHAGNDLICEPKSGIRTSRLSRVGKDELVY